MSTLTHHLQSSSSLFKIMSAPTVYIRVTNGYYRHTSLLRHESHWDIHLTCFSLMASPALIAPTIAGVPPSSRTTLD